VFTKTCKMGHFFEKPKLRSSNNQQLTTTKQLASGGGVNTGLFERDVLRGYLFAKEYRRMVVEIHGIVRCGEELPGAILG
jgi:hypothetical protein